MQVVELSDFSMVIMKDSQDPPWVSVGDVYRDAVKHNRQIDVELLGNTSDDIVCIASSDSICTAGRLVLFFKDKIDSRFCLHSKVRLF